MLSDLKTYCWKLLVNVLLRSVIFRVMLLLSKGTSHLRGGCCVLFWNLVLCFSTSCQRYFFQACHNVPDSWCDYFVAVTKRSQAEWPGEWGSMSWVDISFIFQVKNFSMFMVVKYCSFNASNPSDFPHFPCYKAPQPEGRRSWQGLGLCSTTWGRLCVQSCRHSCFPLGIPMQGRIWNWLWELFSPQLLPWISSVLISYCYLILSVLSVYFF